MIFGILREFSGAEKVIHKVFHNVDNFFNIIHKTRLSFAFI